MFGVNSSFIDFKHSQFLQIRDFFSFVDLCKQDQRLEGSRSRYAGQSAILAFFEASTRTRLSFELACHRVGISPAVFDGGINTSLEKGETVEDSLANMAAMNPRLLIIRCGSQLDLASFAQKFSIPIINAGWGIFSHPSQALLDLYTLRKYWKDFTEKKLLIVGDVKHSRVAASHQQLASVLGFELAQCGPQEFLSDSPLKTFVDLDEGLAWADAVMTLRFQFERHAATSALNIETYRNKFGIHLSRWKKSQEHALLLHPGPINHGIELESEMLSHPHCKVLEQVHNGVFVREALIRQCLGENP